MKTMQTNPKQDEEKKKNHKESIPQVVMKSSKEYAVLVDKWLRRDEKYRADAAHASFVLLMSDFLFSRMRLPVKWLVWASDLKMIGLSADPHHATDKDLQRGALDEAQIIVVKMLFGAHCALKTLINKRYDLIGLMEIMNQIEHQIAQLARAVNVAKGQEQIGKLCNSLNEISSLYQPDEKAIKSLDMNLYAFASSRDRMVLAALLVGRSITRTIIELGSSDEYNIVAEVEVLLQLSPAATNRKESGNTFFQNQEYKKALDKYTKAITLSSYSPVLYSNRCQTALKINKFKLAISDGYRATILRPTWGKAYYRQVEALKGDGQLDAALACNKLGTDLCEKPSDKEDLKSQKRKLENQKFFIAYSSQGVVAENSKESAKSKKGKSSKRNPERKGSGQASDSDSMKGLDHFKDEWIATNNHKTPSAHPPKSSKSKKKSQESSAEISKSSVANEKAKSEQKKMEKVKQNKNRKNDEKLKKEISVNNWPISERYTHHLASGSNAYIAREYSTAAKEYNAAIDFLEEMKLKPDFKVSKCDQFVLIYARGCAAMNSDDLSEVSHSLDFFATLVSANKKNEEILHPMPFYSIAFAQRLLKNYSIASRALATGLKMLEERKKVKRLTYPGVSNVIPESEKGTLLVSMQKLSDIVSIPLKPDAICFYDKCEKDDKYDTRAYAISDKEISRREIYKTDFNFEGFIQVFCSWDCAFSFHYKCWAKFKHTTYSKSGDKEVLDLECFTDGCNGIISRIVMIDQNQSKKKDIQSEKLTSKKKETSAKVHVPRMSKSERNLKRRQKQLQEAKDKKLQSRLSESAADQTDEEKRKKENTKVIKHFTDTDIANATVIKRSDNEQSHHASKTKNKNKTKKKHNNNNVTLQEFLKGYETGITAADMERVIANQMAESPFRVPESLREEIQHFESELSDEDIVRISYLYDYFEDFFLQSGPVKVDNGLLLEQYLMFSEEMKTLLVSSNGIVAFLSKNDDRFLMVHPFIGLTDQSDELVELVQAYNLELQAKQSILEYSEQTSSQASLLDTLDTDFDNPGSLSAFARDLYDLGDIPLNDVANITGSDPLPAPVPTGSRVFPQIVKLSSNVANSSSSSSKSDDKITKSKTEVKKAHLGEGDTIASDNLCSEMDRFLENGRQNASMKDLDSFTDSEGELSIPAIQDRGMHTFGDFGDGNSGSVDMVGSVSSDKTKSEEEPSEEEVKGVVMISSETQTDHDQSYQDEITKLYNEKKLLEKGLDEISSKYSLLCSTSRNEVMTKNQEIARLLEALQIVQQEATQTKLHSEVEIKKISKDRLVLHDNVKAAKAQLKEAEDREIVLKEQMKEQMKEKESDLDRLSSVYQEQRSKWLEEKLSGKREREALNLSLQQANKRCVDAELKALEIEENFGLKALLEVQQECERQAEEFHNLARHHASNPAVQRDILSGYLKWKKNAETCTEHIDQTKQQFAHNAELIRRGQRLNDLATISIPSPPSSGPSIQQATMNALQIRNVGGQVVPLNAFPNNTSPSSSPPVLSYSNDAVPPISAPRVPQPPIGTGKNGGSVNKTTPNTDLATVAPPPEPSTPQPKGSFEKIMVQLRALFPTLSRPDLALCIREVRENNNNSLTGLSFDDIVKQASAVVKKKNAGRSSNNLASGASTHGTKSAMNSTASLWPLNRNGQAKVTNSVQVSDGEPCVICHDPLNSMDVQRLQCGHIFHIECVTKWLERNRTCPTCRDYAIDTSEFPALSSRR